MFIYKCLQAGISRSLIGVSHNKNTCENSPKRNDILGFATLAFANRNFPVISSFA